MPNAIAAALLLGLCAVEAPAELNWPQFRGPDSAGYSAEQHPPTQWSTGENVAWQVEIPGKGWSSPIVWGDRVFLTTVTSEAEGREPRKGLYIQDLQGTVPEGQHRWLVQCRALSTGKLLWEREAHHGTPASTIHLKNSYASETPVTDGKRVFAYFGNVGVFCFDFDGRPVWSQPFAPHATRFGWGTAASPVLHDGKMFIVCDNEEESFLVALDAATGNQLWWVSRDERSNWATPFVWKNNRRTELVVPATGKVRSYDPVHGRLMWEFGGMSNTSIPTPMVAHDLLYVSSGYVGDKVRPIFALRPGASGDISLEEGETSNDFIAWHLPQAGPYHPSPLVVGDYLYVLYDRGMLACYEARSGKDVYGRQRLGSTAFTASPWYADGKIFCLNEDGDTVVVQAGPEFKILGTNSLGDMALATPAIVGNRLLIRTLSRLYCLADKQSSR